MNVEEKEIIESLREQDTGFSRLFDQHAEMDRQIQEMESRGYVSTEVELEIKRLKKLKLRTKDEMVEILKRHQELHSR
ncbi:MAG: YdcH family protein [Candidatus Tectomicrobia bacterium]|nr:YdcH family protein [Candidatus Tectomicrobia bacterium]